MPFWRRFRLPQQDCDINDKGHRAGVVGVEDNSDATIIDTQGTRGGSIIWHGTEQDLPDMWPIKSTDTDVLYMWLQLARTEEACWQHCWPVGYARHRSARLSPRRQTIDDNERTLGIECCRDRI